MRNVVIALSCVVVIAFWFWFNRSIWPVIPVDTSEKQGRIENRKAETFTPSETSLTLAASNADFAFDLYQILKAKEGDLFYSPYSISTALAMTYTGARGETEKEVANALHFTLPQNKLHLAFAELNGALESREGLELSTANALWGQQDYRFLPEFLKTLEDGYGSSLKTLNFAEDEASRKVINDWVAQQTKDRIKDIIPSGVLSEETRLVLANAIYFNAKWQMPFGEAQTKDEPFTLLDKSEVKVPMMFQRTSAGYAKGEGYQVLSLPYDGNMSFVAILPDAGGFETIEAKLEADFVNQLQPYNQEVVLKMPKFEFEKSIDLVKPMQDLGMKTAFTSNSPDVDCQTQLLPGVADFSGMDGGYCLFVGAVLHKAFVKVEEKGTEAAAATVVEVVETTSVAPLPIELTLDRPFIFLIKDNVTGSILFVGRVLNPLG